MRGAVPHKLYPWKDARLKDPADAVPMLFSLNALLHSARALTATIIDSKARSISMIGRALEVEFYVAPAARAGCTASRGLGAPVVTAASTRPPSPRHYYFAHEDLRASTSSTAVGCTLLPHRDILIPDICSLWN
ncbi:hypothetical protein M885DRAFT_561808 [Pelagophyceae sp. CCMP2097]|nr:hypothetical protein M885DRAFT_561808 [Pelagophyceae sp. CCMP2097]|mmetsp:Transcript_12341/g.41120  ORF Transcript_12341/g.41120 Transcript_12341/m.41120 type:complete len:134 (-) Transcript_12341:20-421(-)